MRLDTYGELETIRYYTPFLRIRLHCEKEFATCRGQYSGRSVPRRSGVRAKRSTRLIKNIVKYKSMSRKNAIIQLYSK